MQLERSKHTIQELINQHKVVLHSLLIKLPKVALSQRYKPIQELKDERRIRVALRDRDQIYILVFDMAERGAAQSQDR
jgi:hypothetical protein